jgi:site-specific DNA recombinase
LNVLILTHDDVERLLFYVGRLVWNRLEYVKDPDIGRRVSRRNAESEWRIVEVPELRILPHELWDAAKRRQQALDAKLEGERDPGRNKRYRGG